MNIVIDPQQLHNNNSALQAPGKNTKIYTLLNNNTKFGAEKKIIYNSYRYIFGKDA